MMRSFYEVEVTPGGGSPCDPTGTTLFVGGPGTIVPGGPQPWVGSKKLSSFWALPSQLRLEDGETKQEQQPAASEVEMPMWVWIMIGVGSFLGLSLLVGFALAAILGTIGRQISELQQTEDWTTLPPTRALHDVNEQQPEEQATAARVDRLTRHH